MSKIQSFTFSKRAKEHSLKHKLAISTRKGTYDSIDCKDFVVISLWHNGLLISARKEKLSN